jgi:predicted short-subunit dehydrogenase-like oxidoreductase (DUF2520 family)
MTTQFKPEIIIIGGGRTGAALAWYLHQNNIRPLSLVEKNSARNEYLKSEFQWKFLQPDLSLENLKKSSLVILAVPDDAIAKLSNHLITLPVEWRQKMVIHCSGAQPKSILQALKDKGAITASFHPIYSFAINPRDNSFLKDAWIDIEADEAGQKILDDIFWFHKDRFLVVDSSSKLNFHLASVLFSNFLVTVSDFSLKILQDVPSSQTELFNIFQPLISSTLLQIKNRGTHEAITGPASRGDLETISKHFKLLQKQDSEIFEIYRILTKKILDLQKIPENRQNMILDYLKSL